MLLFLAVALFALLTGGVVALVVFVGRAQQRANLAEVERLGRALGLPEGSPFLVERAGRTFTARYAPPVKAAPASLTLFTPVDETAHAAAGAYRESGRDHVTRRPTILLRPENGADRLGARLGVSRDVRTRDAVFDAAVHISTDSPEEDVQRTLAAPELRAAVAALLASGAARVQLDAEGLSAVLVGPPPYADRFERAAATLAQAAAALPQFQAGNVPRARSPLLFVAALLAVTALITVVPVFALTSAAPSLDGSSTLVGIGGGLALWVLVTLAAARGLRGRSTSLAEIVFVAVVALFLVPPSTYWAVCWANRELDTSPAVDHRTRITRSWTTRNKSSYGYHVEVTSWRPGHATEELGVPSSFAAGATEGRGLVVTTHAGRLGWEWVDSFHLATK